jgi:hypothetical protein
MRTLSAQHGPLRRRSCAERRRTTTTSIGRKRNSAYKAARTVYDARIEEWPLLAQLRAEAERQKERFVELIKAMAEVGRQAAAV